MKKNLPVLRAFNPVYGNVKLQRQRKTAGDGLIPPTRYVETSELTPLMPKEKPWMPGDKKITLVDGDAIHCCGCEEVVLANHVSKNEGHYFCPECIVHPEPTCNANGKCLERINYFRGRGNK